METNHTNQTINQDKLPVASPKKVSKPNDVRPKQIGKNFLTSILEQFQKNPAALVQILASIKQKLPPDSIQSQKPKEQPAKKRQKKATLQHQQVQQASNDTKISRSRSWEMPIKTIEPPAKSCYEKRQHIIINPAEIRRIQTPDWVEKNEKKEEPVKDPIVGFDVEAAHLRLEVYESRIIGGTEERFLHPAMAIRASDLDNELVLSPQEELKSKNYINIEVKQPTPLFWPNRAWDKPETMMSQALNDILYEDIQKITEITQSLDYMRFKPQNASPKLKRSSSSSVARARIKKKNKELVIPISFINYLTDDSDFTDTENF
ncbi:hypothetical protein M9Y10_002637 [Tritrichomonas musculus]|uniref:Uncharacterized protein n=1 Tax=Tritrichomonas musculus TaxID=1915356 RepID=A0ABR2LAF6_9EUKA